MPRNRPKFPYFCLCKYSPSGTTEPSIISRKVAGRIKSGKSDVISTILANISNDTRPIFNDFFNDDTLIVPAPRSSLLQRDDLWPSLIICHEINNVVGCEVSTIIERIKAVPKSHLIRSAEDRPSVQTHLDSLSINSILIPQNQITIVDDFTTLGRTGLACALKISQTYPDHEVKIFSLIRSCGLPNNRELKTWTESEGGLIEYTSRAKAWCQIDSIKTVSPSITL